MAKKTQRIKLSLVCQECKRQNYITEKNKTNTQDKLALKKLCPKCRKVTTHKEKSRLK